MTWLVDLDSTVVAIAATVESWRHTGTDGREYATKTAAKDAGVRVVHSARSLIVDAHQHARSRLRGAVAQFADYADGADMRLYVSHPRNRRRKTLCASYKATRGPSPLMRGHVAHMAVSAHGAVVCADEADDTIADVFRDGDVIVAIDKDFLQIAGSHFNYKHAELGVLTVDADEAEFNFYAQMLCGDRSDNVAGVPGVGPVKAREILTHAAETRRAAVQAAYRDCYGGLQEFELNEALLRLGSRG